MTLRPRYSLLSLLIVTALVALGAKLWHGPHHTVERLRPNFEDEYSYTQDLLGNKVVDGPRIQRHFRADGTLGRILIELYFEGTHTGYQQELHALLGPASSDSWIYTHKFPALSARQSAAFQAAITAECERIRAAGLFADVTNYGWLDQAGNPVKFVPALR